jgi:hypothetical protein
VTLARLQEWLGIALLLCLAGDASCFAISSARMAAHGFSMVPPTPNFSSKLTKLSILELQQAVAPSSLLNPAANPGQEPCPEGEPIQPEPFAKVVSKGGEGGRRE